MSELYKKIIFGVLSVAVIAATIFLIVKPMREDTKSIQAETASLKNYYNELLSKEVNRQQYLNDTETYNAMYDEKLAEFPSNLNQEYQIMLIEGVRKNDEINYDVSALGMAEETPYYSLSGSNSEASLEDGAVSEGLECYKSVMTLSYKGGYEGIKSFMDFIASYPYRMAIDTVSISTENVENDEFLGTMIINLYCIKGEGREEQVDINLDEINTGMDNLFSGGTATGSVSKFAVDKGEAIKSDYDLFIAVNPADSDTSAKLVGLKSGASNVTSSKGGSENMAVKVTSADGAYTVEYGIGSDKQTQTFEPGEDLTLLVQSSDIKDDADTSSINLSIDNSSDKTLYVKVVGDASANRVKITNKAGSVIVYK